MPELAQEKLHSIDDIYNLKDGKRAELIDGHIYYISPPNTNHQRILNFINTEINIYIRNNSGNCEVFPAPFSPTKPRIAPYGAMVHLNGLLKSYHL